MYRIDYVAEIQLIKSPKIPFEVVCSGKEIQHQLTTLTIVVIILPVVLVNILTAFAARKVIWCRSDGEDQTY